jgi:surface protein
MNMAGMFYDASAFKNQDIGAWNVGSVKDMASMFTEASMFNQTIGTWNVGSVTKMQYMFYGICIQPTLLHMEE